MTDSIDLHDLMTEAANGVTPEPPPLARLCSVYRRRQRSRLAAGGVAAALLLAGLSWAALAGPPGRPGRGHHSVRVGPADSGAGSVPATAAPPSAVPLPGEIVIPHLVGLSLSQAERAMPIAGSGARQIVVGNEVVDQSVTPGTVVEQKPPAGATALGVAVTIAVPHTNPCTSQQLALTYVGGSPSAGTDGGTVVVRNVSALWCTFSGPISVVGLDSTSRPVTETVTVPVVQPYILSAGAQAPPHGQQAPFSDIDASIELLAGYRDGPQPDGLCNTMYVIPAVWRLTLPGSVVLTVRNDDPQADVLRGLITCRGQMGKGIPVKFAWP